MNKCGICYSSIKNKVVFECSHEICLICLIKINRIKNEISCPFCRKQIYTESNPKLIKISLTVEENNYQDIMWTDFNEESKYYLATVNEDHHFKFLVLSNEGPVLDLLYSLLIFAIPYNENVVEVLRQGVVNQGQYEIVPVDHHLQDYQDIIIKRVVKHDHIFSFSS